MPIPLGFGKSKIKLLRGGEEVHDRKKTPSDLRFSIGSEPAGGAAGLQSPSFNVLFVETPRVGLLQTAEFQLLADAWKETVDLVKPLLRFGLPETSLRTKCPYYDENLYASSAGELLPNDRLRRLVRGIKRGDLAAASSGHAQHGQHHDQQQQQQHVAAGSLDQQQQQQAHDAIGHGNLDLLGQTGVDAQPRFRHAQLVPRGSFLVPDIPSGSLVLGLNLLAYWAISGQSRRGAGG